MLNQRTGCPRYHLRCPLCCFEHTVNLSKSYNGTTGKSSILHRLSDCQLRDDFADKQVPIFTIHRISNTCLTVTTSHQSLFYIDSTLARRLTNCNHKTFSCPRRLPKWLCSSSECKSIFRRSLFCRIRSNLTRPLRVSLAIFAGSERSILSLNNQ